MGAHMTEPAKDGATSRWLSAKPPRAVAQPPSTTEMAMVPSTGELIVGSAMSTTAEATKPAARRGGWCQRGVSTTRSRVPIEAAGWLCGSPSAVARSSSYTLSVSLSLCLSVSLCLSLSLSLCLSLSLSLTCGIEQLARAAHGHALLPDEAIRSHAGQVGEDEHH
jgi:hypothetical protein